MLYNTNSFLYEIVNKDKENTQLIEIYSGSYTFNNDTVFLRFKSKKQPINIKPFLIRESTGNYLAQQFNDNAPRIFFRLPGMPRHPHTVF